MENKVNHLRESRGPLRKFPQKRYSEILEISDDASIKAGVKLLVHLVLGQPRKILMTIRIEWSFIL